ncbi:MAG: hypothetical protein UW99_C0035G0002 [Candidatus Collierbacteria bacterium GW2011_GWC2_45_15]|uniref:ATPase BadF/BadG/BcrA/BcrD type domain-containing protein n=1 Tax=Candidatus Collierbacteria bacterium GW2011_GWC2_45_15 TaxID=1618394 RepID=A0A0G1LNI4_9BACT|nr:MAG: hypothetical protein UW99_C0035G0002 [Candidatus Collierbacteria bacterium GW2011_GWC2_45_15]
MNNVVIGFDCGATHTRVAVWKGEVIVLQKDDIPGINLDVTSKSVATDLMIPIVRVLSKFQDAAWVVGMAGLDNEDEVKEAEEWMRRILTASGVKYSSLKMVSDVDLVLWSGSPEGVGIALIAGTGSNCVGRNRSGKQVKSGGMSHLMSDEGSGFALGWRCLHLVTKMSDGRAVTTKLLKDVLGLYKKRDVVGLKNWLVESENMKMEVSRAAIPFLMAAERGERMADEGVQVEVAELVQMITSVNRRLSPIHHLPVYLAGSLFRDEYFLKSFKNKLKATFYDQQSILVTPLLGALNIARQFD